MPITDVSTDPERLTLTVVGDYDVPVERLWEAWIDPRRVERFWGPPGWPATFTRHDVAVGGRSEYVMTGPDGERSRGWWRFEHVDDGRAFEILDGFADADGGVDDSMPTMRMRLDVEAAGAGSRMRLVTTFPDVDAMERLLEMGMREGLSAALGQADDVVADLASLAAGEGVEVTALDDRRLRITRPIRGTVDEVWRACHDADLVRRWMLGPDGWTMPVCDQAEEVGDAYRWEWASEDGAERFGFEGELLESAPPRRWVATQAPIGADVEPNVNATTLTPFDGGTLLTLVVTCSSTEVRDEMLASGMGDGMEASYARLEDAVLATTA